MAEKTWTFDLEDGSHTVELEHGTISGKRVIRVDGEVVEESTQLIDMGSIHPFEINAHRGSVVIRTNGITFSYDAVLDGRSLETGKPVALPRGLAVATAAAASTGKLVGDEPVAGKAIPIIQLDPAEEAHESVLKEIRSWGQWLLALGAIHLIASGTLSAAWGVILVLVGLGSFLFHDAAMFVVYGTTLAWVAFTNASGGPGPWLVFALLQFYVAFRVFQQFFRFRRTEAEYAALQAERDLATPPVQRTAQTFPWLGCLLAVVATGGLVLLMLTLIVLGPEEVPAIVDPLFEALVDLGVVGFAVSLASLLSGFRNRFLATLGVALGGLVLLGGVLLAVL